MPTPPRPTRLLPAALLVAAVTTLAGCTDGEVAADPTTITPTFETTMTTTVDTTVDATVVEPAPTPTATPTPTPPPGGTLVVTVTGTTAPVATTPPATVEDAAAWLSAAHRLNLARIASGRSAEVNAVTADVRALGPRWVGDYTNLDAELQARARARGVALPDGPDPTSAADLAAVERQPGDAYDASWVAYETGEITRYLALVDRAGAVGDPDVTAVAAITRPILEEHLRLLAAVQRPVKAVPAGEGPLGGPGRQGALLIAGAGAVLVVVALTGAIGGAARGRRRG